MADSTTLFQRVGGRPYFRALTERFYAAVAGDPVLLVLYPDDPEAFEAARLHLELFLIQYWGGPGDYNAQRGNPRLRMRHAPFVIGPDQRDAWLRHMVAAVEADPIPALEQLRLIGYFTTAADHLVNQP